MIFIRARVFGLTLAIAVGPIALVIIRHAAMGSLRAGLASACGAAFADLTYAMIALSVGTIITPVLTAHTAQAHTVTAMILIAFGLWLMWTAIRPHPLTSGTGSLCVQIMLAFGGPLLGRGMQMLNVVSGTGIVLFGIVGLFG